MTLLGRTKVIRTNKKLASKIRNTCNTRLLISERNVFIVKHLIVVCIFSTNKAFFIRILF